MNPIFPPPIDSAQPAPLPGSPGASAQPDGSATFTSAARTASSAVLRMSRQAPARQPRQNAGLPPELWSMVAHQIAAGPQGRGSFRDLTALRRTSQGMRALLDSDAPLRRKRDTMAAAGAKAAGAMTELEQLLADNQVFRCPVALMTALENRSFIDPARFDACFSHLLAVRPGNRLTEVHKVLCEGAGFLTQDQRTRLVHDVLETHADGLWRRLGELAGDLSIFTPDIRAQLANAVINLPPHAQAMFLEQHSVDLRGLSELQRGRIVGLYTEYDGANPGMVQNQAVLSVLSLPADEQDGHLAGIVGGPVSPQRELALTEAAILGSLCLPPGPIPQGVADRMVRLHRIDPEDAALIIRPNRDQVPSLHCACIEEDPAAIRQIVAAIQRLPVSDQAKEDLLASNSIEERPALYAALRYDLYDSVVAFADAIRALPLTDAAREHLLRAEDVDFGWGFREALMYNHADAIDAYADAVLQSGLPRDRCQVLLMGGEPLGQVLEGSDGLHRALKDGHAETIGAYLSALGRLGLTGDQWTEMLTARSEEDRVSGIAYALAAGKTEAVAKWGQALCAAPITAADKTALLQAPDDDDRPALHATIAAGHADTAALYIRVIDGAGLPHQDAAALMAAKHEDVPAFAEAMRQGDPRSIAHIVLTLAATSLPIADKAALLAATHDGQTVLQSAVAAQNWNAVNAYRYGITMADLPHYTKAALLDPHGAALLNEYIDLDGMQQDGMLD